MPVSACLDGAFIFLSQWQPVPVRSCPIFWAIVDQYGVPSCSRQMRSKRAGATLSTPRGKRPIIGQPFFYSSTFVSSENAFYAQNGTLEANTRCTGTMVDLFFSSFWPQVGISGVVGAFWGRPIRDKSPVILRDVLPQSWFFTQQKTPMSVSFCAFGSKGFTQRLEWAFPEKSKSKIAN